ncbi:MAG: serine hydrolase [Gammaproteobacteria bacterium]|nr:serine hydrolase [Gammaproteobacteria bacterium]
MRFLLRCVHAPIGAAVLVLGSGAAARAVEAPATPAGAESEAAAWLDTIKADPELQAFVDGTVAALRKTDPGLRRQTVRVAVIDLPTAGPARLAHWNGTPVYPASVPKFVYLMAALAWRDQGRLEIEPTIDHELREMVYASSNKATQKVVARLTGTRPGPRLGPSEYRAFRDKRLAVKRWLASLGITDLHTVHPTYDGGDISPREQQFLSDPAMPGGLPARSGAFRNRQAMTAVGSARLLALLATDRALAPATCEEVRRRMQRDVAKQPYLRHRIAGGAARSPGFEVYSKTGTWGPIHADAGIVRHRSGHQIVVAAFVEGTPRYRGSFIADFTDRVVRHLVPGQ